MSLLADLSAQEGSFALCAKFTLPPRARAALIGPNGSGKTTLLRTLAGVVAAQGEVSFRGKAWLQRTAQVAPQSRRIGMVFQGGALLPMMSARENVAFGARARGKSKQEAFALADHWLERVDAFALADQTPASLSGGEAQRVALARAFASEPELLLLDEPLVGVDRSRWVDLMTLLQGLLADFEGSALIVSHQASLVRSLCDRALVLEGGRVVSDGDLEVVVKTPPSSFAAGFFGRVAFAGGWVNESEIQIVAPESRSKSAVQTKVRFVEVLAESYRVHGEMAGLSCLLGRQELLPQVGAEIWLDLASSAIR